MSNTLLLTWTINPYKDIKAQWYPHKIDIKTRLSEYIDAIIYYISNSNFTHIIFCENSNYSIPPQDLEIINSTCDYYNKDFELLQFVSNHTEIKNRWYNYWEGECIDYAFENSRFLKKAKSWYKITWRYKYRNINDIINEWENQEWYFYRFSFPWLYWCVSAIFKCNNEIYEEYLYNAKNLVDYMSPTWVRSYEMIVFYKLRPILSKLPPIKTIPIFHNEMKRKHFTFRLFSNYIYLSRYIWHRWWLIDRFYNIFWNFYCRTRLKLK